MGVATRPWAWSGSGSELSGLAAVSLAAPMLRAGLPVLQHALARVSGAASWRVVLGLRSARLGRGVDVVLATGRAVVAIQVRAGTAFKAVDRMAAEDAALDLADFHEGCRALPVVPVVLLLGGSFARQQFPLPLAGAAPVMEATRLSLPGLLTEIAAFPDTGGRPEDWVGAAFRPVPGLLDAACTLYGDHGVSELRLAEAGSEGVRRARAAISAAVEAAKLRGGKAVVFVTGEPGAGKTFCGLDLAFAPGSGALFLTGNPTLVHLLREALVRDAVARGTDRHAARRRLEAVIQGLPGFRDHYAGSEEAPPERLIVIDEAQRCWSRRHAVGKTRNRAVPLRDSEAAHVLDAAARRPGGSVVVCLVGGGQEIHDGEGGLAAWGEALEERPEWLVFAAPGAVAAPDPRQRLPSLPGLRLEADLHLRRPVRAVRAPSASAWVDAVLAGDSAGAAEIARASGGVPFAVTRSLRELRDALRVRGTRSAGLVASSTARRLRAEGLGAVLPHQDEDAVARWFLDRWPDIRSSDALEVVASEFAVQGLELHRIGLCWDLDLVRAPDGWEARRFRGTAWVRAGAEARSNRINAYRVLLTRARHGTVIWVPRGNGRDRTRDPGLYDSIASFLRACGATGLDGRDAPAEASVQVPEPALL